ncbi:Na+/H+ antiporter subunit E [Rivularia sp. UHCC 0363]|uniref:Na+/H+ antiporter subunit E n=1 Tax=Rivularia sp. UHCC 0363 TaxID=3110244 RepID=UPI002B21493F|nr:Na+/H+ antiporter subunit E [Rivularia sp. UHCC 0363]MEA5596481.1 Na+/H+ antiporter subunit E [Rivularia sp. UHCC 0363]
MVGHLILRLTIWFLLTSDLSAANIIIGVIVALLLPRGYPSPEALKDWLQVLGKIIVAIPQAYIEAVEIIIRPHEYEDIVREQVQTTRSPRLIFLDIFLITFTPKTIVFKYRQDGWYEVHRVRPTRAIEDE